MTAVKAWSRALAYTKAAAGTTLPVLLEDLAERFGTRPALLGETESLDFSALVARVNRYARWAMAEGFQRGDVIGLLMPNCPDYVALWLALTRIGCRVALLNTNIRDDARAHCIKVANARALIVAEPLAAGQEPPVERVLSWDAVRRQAGQCSASPLSAVDRPEPGACALLIYTSGTTGWPKATIITHRRIAEWSFWFAGMMDVQPDDRMYNCLPMYHSVGGVVAIGAMLVRGGSVVIRNRFSASRFWDDVAGSDCTIFQYIGELCRYLTASPARPSKPVHRLRLACGNGLQPDVWPVFQEQFAIPEILEFYAATEGNLSLYNCEGRPGAIGRVPPFLAHRFAAEIIRCDLETGVPLRDADGRCIQCGVDEPGEAVSRMDAARRFDGYTDPQASARKILRDVFADGDQWFRSGDFMRRDAAGYYYFVDRISDTFRWKGENVSTTEVSSVLRSVPGVVDAVVYGVSVPGHEGRAGMAALVTDDRFRFDTFAEHIHHTLPAYARPLLIRKCQSLDITGTFKLTKTELMSDGYLQSNDPVWYWNSEAQAFALFARDTWQAAPVWQALPDNLFKTVG